jgi:hypothetical protein
MNIGCCRLNLSVKSLTANLPCGLAELARPVYTPARAFWRMNCPDYPPGTEGRFVITLSDYSPMAMAWTSASVQRPQP